MSLATGAMKLASSIQTMTETMSMPMNPRTIEGARGGEAAAARRVWLEPPREPIRPREVTQRDDEVLDPEP